jgi:hypothetical protein
MLVHFSTDELVSISKVGGKAASLISLQQGGANVPAGFVLTSEYFASWLDRVEACEAWREALSILTKTGVRQPDLATRTRLADVCDRSRTSPEGSTLPRSNARSWEPSTRSGRAPMRCVLRHPKKI